MKIKVPKGRYVVAVSGGVDSVVLLDMLSRQPGLDLMVAHFNHGIRPDAGQDEQLVRVVSKKYRLPYEVGYGRLGPKASEEQARKTRYQFLNSVKKKHNARAIITAHHQDDLIETAFLNILRGTGRRGLTAISENPDVLRPMLGLSKAEVLAYAEQQRLRWHEDPSNQDERLLRNYIRRRIVPKLAKNQRQKLLRTIHQTAAINKTLNQEIANLSQNIVKGKKLNRANFIVLPAEIADEVLMHFLRQNGVRDFDKKTIARLAIVIKTAKPNTVHDIVKGTTLEMTPSTALLRTSVDS